MAQHFYDGHQVQAIRDRKIVWVTDHHAEIAGKDADLGHGITHICNVSGSYGWLDGVLYWRVPVADEQGSIALGQNPEGLDPRADKLEKIVRKKIETALRKAAADIEENVIDAA